MDEDKRLGRIASAEFGYGGYQDAQFGLSIAFEGDGWGVGTFVGGWATDIKPDDHTEWDEADRDASFASTVRKVNELLHSAKIAHVSQLKGIPVELAFEGIAFKDWRVLTEVL